MARTPATGRGCAHWLKWVVGSCIALLGAGGGIVALYDYFIAEPVVITTEAVNIEDLTPVPDAAPKPVSAPAEAVPTPFPLPANGTITPAKAQEIGRFLSQAVQAEIMAYWYGDATYAAPFYGGEIMETLQYTIAELNTLGVTLAASFDFEASYVAAIRPDGSERIEVDTCEVWQNEYYQTIDGSYLGTEAAQLVPQTLVLREASDGWVITAVTFYDPPAFC